MLAQHSYSPPGAPPTPASESIAAFFANPYQFVQDALAAALANWQPPVTGAGTPVPDPDELLDVAAAAGLLGVVKQTIHDYVKREVLRPHRMRPGGKLYFKRGEVLAALQGGNSMRTSGTHTRRPASKKA